MEVVAVTPGGRADYLKILAKYILREDHIDRWDIWMNTIIPEDVSYIETLSAQNPDRIKVIRPASENLTPSIYSIAPFFLTCVDPSTIYIRFDDDIVFIAPDAVENLLKFRCDHPQYFLVFANTINNSICSFLHQHFGSLPPYHSSTSYTCLDPVSWGDPSFAEIVHRQAISLINSKQYQRFYFPSWELPENQRFSINCFSFFGCDFAEFGGIVDREEEIDLTMNKTKDSGRINAICGNALVSHFAYFTQRSYMNQTDVLSSYGNMIDIL